MATAAVAAAAAAVVVNVFDRIQNIINCDDYHEDGSHGKCSQSIMLGRLIVRADRERDVCPFRACVFAYIPHT